MIKILLVEDDPEDLFLFQDMLSGSTEHQFVIAHAERLRTALEQLSIADLDLILLDLSLPDSQGLETLTQIHQAAPHLPVVVLTGLSDSAIAFQAIREGAQDYLVKQEIDPQLLLRSIHYAIERSRVEAELKIRAAQQAAVASMGQQALAERDLERLMAIAVTLVAKTLEVEYAQVLELLPDGEFLLLRAGYGWSSDLVGRRLVNADSQSQAGYTLAMNQPVITPDLHQENRFVSPDLLLKLGLVSGVSAVISGPDRPFGVLGIYTCHARTFSQDDVHFLQAIANILATGIERQQRETALRQQANREHLVMQLTQRIRQSLNLEEILATTVAEVQRLLGADRVLILQFLASRRSRVITESLAPGWLPLQGQEFEPEQFPDECFQRYQRGEPSLIHDLNTADLAPCLMDFLQRWQIQAKLVVPILVNEQPWGLLLLHQCDLPRQWQPWEVSLLQQLALQVAIAIQQAELYRQVQIELTERKQAEALLAHQAFYDPLTHLPNRTLFMERLGRAIDRIRAFPGAFYAVLFLDLDRFKLINDSLGHLVGDQFLQTIAQRLVNCLKPGDTVSRFGGDEFAVLLDNLSSLGEIDPIVDVIQRQLSLPFKLHKHEVFTTASIGIALSTTGYSHPQEVLRDADIAMYQAKAQGKAHYVTFDATMHEQAIQRLQLETDLWRAIERQEFLLYYQPIVCLQTGQLCGFEALVRWRHPERGLVSPAVFIPLAEETGLIRPIGQWVLREACHQLRLWQKQFANGHNVTMSVNLSSKQVSQENLVERILMILEEAGVPHHCLRLEITESLLMENLAAATETLWQLRNLGLHLSMDDFGTGYSSLSYLHRFPIDTLKIDRSFIKQLCTGSQHLEIVRTILALARSLNKSVIAEGIETLEQLNMLRVLDCKFGQGYLFARPLTAAAATEFLGNQTLASQAAQPNVGDQMIAPWRKHVGTVWPRQFSAAQSFEVDDPTPATPPVTPAGLEVEVPVPGATENIPLPTAAEAVIDELPAASDSTGALQSDA